MYDPEYSFASPRRQLFAVPQDVIFSMLENPSSHIGLLKLYQTCKYFYGKRPILIADHVNIEMSDRRQVPNVKLEIAGQDVFHLQIPIWLTKKVNLFGDSNRYQRLPLFFRYSTEEICLYNKVLQFEDFVLLTAEKKVYNFQTIHWVCHSDMSKATIDEILMHLPNVKRFDYFLNERHSAKILKNLNKIKLDTKLGYLCLDIIGVHPSFDLDIFYEFIEKNCCGSTQLVLWLYSNAKETLNASLAKLDSKWHTEDNLAVTRMFLKPEINLDEKQK